MQSWGFDSYGRDLVSVGAIASWPTGSAEAYWSLFIDEDYVDPRADGEHDPLADGVDNEYTRYIKNGVVQEVKQTGTEGGDMFDRITDVDLDRPLMEAGTTFVVPVERYESIVPTNLGVQDGTSAGTYRGPGFIHDYKYKAQSQAIQPMDFDSPFFVVGGLFRGNHRVANYTSDWKIMNSGLPKHGKFQYGLRNTKTDYHIRIERHRLQTANGGELGTHINYGIGGKKHYFPFNSSRYQPYVRE